MSLRFRILVAASGDPAATTATVITPNALVSAGSTGPREVTPFAVSSDRLELFVGRRADADLSLPFASVSARHARLFRGDTEREWWVEDLGSANGTWLDEARVWQDRAAPLRAGQRLRVGTVDLLFDGWSATSREDEGTGTLARRLISDLFSSPDGEVASLVVQGGPVRAEPLRLTQRDRRYVAGRAETCDLVLPSEHVSREHAAFARRRDGVFVQDLGSRNSVRVNGVPVKGEARLAESDRIEVGAVVLALSDPEQRYHDGLQRMDADAQGAAPADGAGSRNAERASTPTVAWPVAGAAVSPSPPPRPPVVAESPRPPAPPTAAAQRPRPRRTVALILVGGIVVLAVVGLIALLATWG